jgi:MFS family permease
MTWFMKRRAFAIGIVAAGSSVGGVIFPIMLDRLVQSIGFSWAMRTCAFLILGLLICSNLTVHSRFGPRQTAFSVAALLRPLTEVSFLLTTAASFIFYLGLFLPINYLQFQALMYGMDPSLANYLIPILNGARQVQTLSASTFWVNNSANSYHSLFGRILPGYIADKVGRYNTIIIMAFLTSLFTLALWIPAKGNTPLIVFAAIYGFCSGAFVSLLPAIIAQISDIKEIGLRTGLEFAILSIPALVSNPIGGAFIDLENGKFRDLQIWTGVVLLAGSFLYVAARASLVGLRIAVKV